MTDNKDLIIVQLEKENAELKAELGEKKALLDELKIIDAEMARRKIMIEALDKGIARIDKKMACEKVERAENAYQCLREKQSKGRVKLEKKTHDLWLPYKKLFQEKTSRGMKESTALNSVGEQMAKDGVWPKNKPVLGEMPDRGTLRRQLVPKEK